jgi:hypothetical protein
LFFFREKRENVTTSDFANEKEKAKQKASGMPYRTAAAGERTAAGEIDQA